MQDKDILLLMANKFISIFVFGAVLVGLSAIYFYGKTGASSNTTILLAVAVICILFGLYQFISFRIELVSPDNCKALDKVIALMILVDLAIGVIVAIYYHSGQNNVMFAPLIIGFVCVFILYYLIEKRMGIKAGKPVEKY